MCGIAGVTGTQPAAGLEQMTDVDAVVHEFCAEGDLFAASACGACVCSEQVAPTLLAPGEHCLRFEYVVIVKCPDAFAYVAVVSFFVDLDAGTVREETITPGYSYSQAAPHSHIKETVGFGSYVPA